MLCVSRDVSWHLAYAEGTLKPACFRRHADIGVGSFVYNQNRLWFSCIRSISDHHFIFQKTFSLRLIFIPSPKPETFFFIRILIHNWEELTKNNVLKIFLSDIGCVIYINLKVTNQTYTIIRKNIKYGQFRIKFQIDSFTAVCPLRVGDQNRVPFSFTRQYVKVRNHIGKLTYKRSRRGITIYMHTHG